MICGCISDIEDLFPSRRRHGTLRLEVQVATPWLAGTRSADSSWVIGVDWVSIIESGWDQIPSESYSEYREVFGQHTSGTVWGRRIWDYIVSLLGQGAKINSIPWDSLCTLQSVVIALTSNGQVAFVPLIKCTSLFRYCLFPTPSCHTATIMRD